MHTHHPRSVACGLALGLALAWGLGTARQPVQGADAPPDDPVLRELALLHGGLFAEQSRLPLDPERSIEQMLGAQSAAIARLEARVAADAPGDIHALQRRVAELEGAIGAGGAADAGSLTRELQDLRRSIADLDRRVENVPQSDLGQLARTVQDLQRRVDRQAQRSSASLDSELRSMELSLRTLADRVRSLERRIP